MCRQNCSITCSVMGGLDAGADRFPTLREVLVPHSCSDLGLNWSVRDRIVAELIPSVDGAEG